MSDVSIPDVICPKCGSVAKIQLSMIHGVRRIRHHCCGLWSWDGKPLVDGDTHRARIAAHTAFDRIWRERWASRDRAYILLAERLGVPEPQAHMSVMDRETAERVPPIVDLIIGKIKLQKRKQREKHRRYLSRRGKN